MLIEITNLSSGDEKLLIVWEYKYDINEMKGAEENKNKMMIANRKINAMIITWDPLVLGPAFAILSRYGRSWRRAKFSS